MRIKLPKFGHVQDGGELYKAQRVLVIGFDGVRLDWMYLWRESLS